MLKKILGDSPVTSIVGILAAFFVVLQEQLITGEVTLVNALIAAAVAVVGRFLPDGPLKMLIEVFASKSAVAEASTVVEEPVAAVEEPVKVEEPVAVEAPKPTIVKKTKK
jgi:hypothetical protein